MSEFFKAFLEVLKAQNWKAVIYKFYLVVMYPVLDKLVKSNDEKNIFWDNNLLFAIDFIIKKFLSPSEAAEPLAALKKQ